MVKTEHKIRDLMQILIKREHFISRDTDAGQLMHVLKRLTSMLRPKELKGIGLIHPTGPITHCLQRVKMFTLSQDGTWFMISMIHLLFTNLLESMVT
jgi:hypothetical protein